MARLEVGARGPIDGQTWLVLARLTYKTDDGKLWDEYLLANGRTRRWLTFEEARGFAYLWREGIVNGFPKPESLSIDGNVAVEKLDYRIDERGTKTLVDIDGTPEDDAESGEVAYYAEGWNDTFRFSAERAGASATEVYVGVPYTLDKVKHWTKPAPRLRKPPPRVVTQATEVGPLTSFAIGALFLGFVISVEGCWHDDECRYYRADGTSYTGRCSHYDANSVRVESTGRRLHGFGK